MPAAHRIANRLIGPMPAMSSSWSAAAATVARQPADLANARQRVAVAAVITSLPIRLARWARRRRLPAALPVLAIQQHRTKPAQRSGKERPTPTAMRRRPVLLTPQLNQSAVAVPGQALPMARHRRSPTRQVPLLAATVDFSRAARPALMAAAAAVAPVVRVALVYNQTQILMLPFAVGAAAAVRMRAPRLPVRRGPAARAATAASAMLALAPRLAALARIPSRPARLAQAAPAPTVPAAAAARTAAVQPRTRR